MNFLHPGMALSFITLVASVACAEDRIRVVDRPPAKGKNAFYFGNREPLAPSPLVKLPAEFPCSPAWPSAARPLLAASPPTLKKPAWMA